MDEMLASNYYLLDLKEGEDFSFDEIDVKKEAKLKRKDRPNDIGYKIFQEMYGTYCDFESSKIDKWNMNTFLGKKDISKGVVDRKVEERIQPQELDPHNHNGGQGGTNDGR